MIRDEVESGFERMFLVIEYALLLLILFTVPILAFSLCLIVVVVDECLYLMVALAVLGTGNGA